ncbi:Hypothetical porin precursor [Mycobacteroides abscessus subsp. abscessus]|uniref:MspA family porin n=1 Tax=Mycobacteroides abscessus TaxID=36809 RepID=UPI0009A7685D|nr:MspA family porin [Mycobacteroides abscessus]SKQ14355.1 Hypothetical porin precursor [Mycobacteroides abscessus subsp. abscessus]
MKLLGKVSGWARRGVLAVGALLMTLVALIATTATAHAGLDDELTLVDGKGRLLRIQQWDTFLNGVFPLDRNRLTREWFHSGRAVYEVTGAGSDTFEGTLELGYQVGYPWSLGVGLNFNYTTPNTSSAVAVSNAHGTVTGAAGGVLLRPYARLISSAGDSVTTYGETWDMK